MHVHICSRNNFPTAAGLASSASGFAALVYSLAVLYEIPHSDSPSREKLSLIARQGSGSACRSLFGGFVAWEMGTYPGDGSDSKAVQIQPHTHWPDMHALICVVSDDKKGTSSTSGMQRTVQTSDLLKHRVTIVDEKMKRIIAAINERNFDEFARITMQDSNQFHAVALDTDPPIFYMNDVSRAIIAVITEYNRLAVETTGKRKAAYTFDAGPNAVIYAEEKNMAEIISMIVKYFPQAQPFSDPLGVFKGQSVQSGVVGGFNTAVAKQFEVGAVKTLIHTRIGEGPKDLGEEKTLLGPNGLPKTLT